MYQGQWQLTHDDPVDCGVSRRPADRAGAIRVLLVDDQAASRQVAALRLGEDPSITVVGEAASEAEAAALVVSLDPDVALLDLLLPGQNGLVVARHLHDLSPRLRVLMTGDESSPGLDGIARGAGTAGFLSASALSAEAFLTFTTGRRPAAPPVRLAA